MMTIPKVSASFLRRFAAMFYDFFLLLALWMLGTLLILPLAHDGTFQAHNPIYTAYLLAIHAIFYIWFWTHSGQTLGMKSWGITVEANNTTSTLTLGQALLRWATAVVSVLFFGLGFIWMLFDPKKRTLYDLVSGSEVIYQPKQNAS